MVTVTEVKGVGPVTQKLLAKAGFKSAKKLAKARSADIVLLTGVGERRASMLIEAANALLSVLEASSEKPSAKGGKKAKKPKKKKSKKEKAKQAKKAKKMKKSKKTSAEKNSKDKSKKTKKK